MVYIQVRVPPFYSVVAVVSVLVVFTWNVIVYNWATAALLSTVVRHMLTIQETAWSWVEWILFNAGHEPELQSYTAAVDTWIQSLLPLSLYSELFLWFWGRGSSSEWCEVTYLGNVVGTFRRWGKYNVIYLHCIDRRVKSQRNVLAVNICPKWVLYSDPFQQWHRTTALLQLDTKLRPAEPRNIY